MSLKPLKKSDLGKDWISKRRDRRIRIRPEYHLIVTEGEKTEPLYFQRFKEEINKKYRERIHFSIIGAGENTVSLFETARRYADKSVNGYKHVWIVYDTDCFPRENVDEVPLLCKKYSTEKQQYHAIWSNQCIELWYLLHFELLQSDLHRSRYTAKLSSHLKKLKAGAYKKNRADMFTLLKPFVKAALKNARKLALINGEKPPSLSAPGTNVHEIVERLFPYIT